MYWQGRKEPFRKWNDGALKHIESIALKEQKADVDYVILAALKYVGQKQCDGVSVSEPFLKRLLSESARSPWADWAYWQRTRLLSEEAWTFEEDLGVVPCDIGSTKRLGCLTDNPREIVKARGAAAWLRKHPRTYMARQMRLDLYQGRMWLARTALESLASNEWFIDKDDADGVFPLTGEQVDSVRRARDAVRSVGKAVPRHVEALAQAEDKVDDFLWNAHPKENILIYLRGVVNVKGKDALPATVRQWLQKLPPTKQPERHRWEPGE